MKSYRLNYSKRETKNFINIGNHSYNVFCSDGKAIIPMGNQTIRTGGYNKLALKESMDTPLTKEEFNSMFPPIRGKKYIASRKCAKIAYEQFGRKDIIFVYYPTGEGKGDWSWLYTF